MSSIDYYDINGEAFFADTVDVEDLPQRRQFLAHVPSGGAVLEAGCGSGRDARFFAQSGLAVTAFDGSATMARLASEHTGLKVLHATFADMAWTQAFDGVWACASLLHVPKAELPDALARIRRALKPGGVVFASFKRGSGERFAKGRWFTDLEPDGLATLLNSAGFESLETDISTDLRPGRQHEQWVSALARRPLVETDVRA